MNKFQQIAARLLRIPTYPKINQRRYASASNDNILSSGWVATGSSSNSEAWSGLRILRNRARSLYNDDPIIQGGIDEIVENVVDVGIKLQSKVKLQRKDEYNLKLNSQIEALWSIWAENPKFCHTQGTLSLYDIQKLITHSSFVDGEVLIRLVRQSFNGSPVPLALEVIEADQLDDRINQYRQSETGNQIRLGVELNDWSAPIAYWLLTNHPGDVFFSSTNTQPQRIPAQDIIHYYSVTGIRPGQVRFVSRLHAAILKAKNLEDYESYEVVKAKMQSAIGGFFESEWTQSMSLPEDEDGSYVDYLEPGIIKKLRPGEKFSGFDPSSPNPNLPQFVKHILKGIAKGLRLSYYGLTGDYESTNFSSVRAALLSERKTFKIAQEGLITRFLRPLYHEWLKLAELNDALNLPGYNVNPYFYQKDVWTGAGWEWVDPFKDLKAAELALKLGTTTITKELAKLGLDIEDVLAEKSQEKMLYEKYGFVYCFDYLVEEAESEETQEEDSSKNKRYGFNYTNNQQ